MDEDQPSEAYLSDRATVNTARKRFGSEVKRLREAAGLTQQALADKVGVSAAMVSHLEGGRRGATADFLANLEVALGLDPAQLADLRHAHQASRLSPDLRQWIVGGPDVTWVNAAGDVVGVGEVKSSRPGSPESSTAESWVETRLRSYLDTQRLHETQLVNALKGDFKPDRLARLAAVFSELQDLNVDDLLRVSGFIAGLKAATSPPSAAPSREQAAAAAAQVPPAAPLRRPKRS